MTLDERLVKVLEKHVQLAVSKILERITQPSGGKAASNVSRLED
jgi:hypothetical protein